MTEKLSEDNVDEELGKLQIWGREGDRLATRVEFDGYRDAVFFANAVFSLAEEEFHHPKIIVEYGSVEIELWSHDVEGITERDIEMAKMIEERVGKIKWS